MYSHCIHCHSNLGRNDSIEPFPVGRRIAFDGRLGRLWVVCRYCEKWNLSPFEERWEAIEECERLYRATRLRLASDNIGLARLRDGTDLVRIGAPLRPEFAAWRYGDQFGRRRRIRFMHSGVGLAAVGAATVGASAIGLAVGTIGYLCLISARAVLFGAPKEILSVVNLPSGLPATIRRADLASLRILRHEPIGEWSLMLVVEGTRTELAPGEATVLLGKLLPHLNLYGGTGRRVKQATAYLESLPDVGSVFRRAGFEPLRRDNVLSDHSWLAATYPPGQAIRDQPGWIRLALEMAAHEDIERRALEGELALLERCWREAEEIAAIADGLAFGSKLEHRFAAIKAGISRQNDRGN